MKHHPLSFAQQRLWFLEQFAPGTALYNVPLVLDIDGPLDRAVLEHALGEIVRRHEPLRTIFTATDGVPTQKILPPGSFQLTVEDVSRRPDEDEDAAVDRIATQEVRRPFDLSTGPVIRALLLRRSATQHVLIATLHHIATDGWSLRIFARELTVIYGAFFAGEPSPLPPLPLRYVDFAVRQRAELTSAVFTRQMAYWKDRLRPQPPLLALPADFARPAAPSFRGHRHSLSLPPALLQAVESLGRQEGATLFMTMLAAYGALLYRLTGQTDLLIGTPIANRTREDIEPLIGFFVNSLAIRLDAAGDPSFRTFLVQTKAVALGAYGNQDLPFEQVIEAINPDRTVSHTPLLQTFFLLDRNPFVSRAPAATSGVRFQRRAITTGTCKFDMMLAIRPAESGGLAALESSADLFAPSTGARVLEEYRQLLESIVADPDASIARRPALAGEELRLVTVEWNATTRPYAMDDTLSQMFERQVEHRPSADALIAGHERLTYDDLNQRANRIAQLLRTRGVGPDDRVGICLERSPALVAAILAVLKAGGAYVPLDPAYPRDRLAFVARDAQCRIILTEAALTSLVAECGAEVILLGAEVAPPADGACPGNPEPSPRPDHLAYVIYTSGSTGQPKGVAVEHRQVVNLLAWAFETFARDELSGMLASTSISFDLSVFELFVPLCSGGTVILVDNLLALSDAPARERVTFVNTVPSVMRELMRLTGLPPGVRVVALAGERLPSALVDDIYDRSSAEKVVDLYGPTETTVYATCAFRARKGPETIGRPIANTTARVLDQHRQPVAVGVAGELYVGGAGVARGYLGRPDLTAERFVIDSAGVDSSERLYRTGDRVRWRPDGTLEFLGRMDRQVKVRGFRIEPGEIEAALANISSIREAVVITREDVADDVRLIAYLVENDASSDDEIYRRLEQRLPHYMLPAAFMRLDALPRLPNGKVNRGALPMPARQPHVTVLPRTASEEAVAAVWREVLDLAEVGVHDQFFLVGGHSLLAMLLASRLARIFGVSIDVRAVFKAPTIAEQARLLVELGSTPASSPEAMLAGPSAASRHRLLYEWAGATAPYPRDRTIAEQFEHLVLRQPAAPALASADGSLTYAELNERANRLAHHLQSRLRPGSADLAIGVCLERSPDTIVALLAIAKAGAAYVPLDPSYPIARLEVLASRVALALIVTTSAHRDRLMTIDVPAVLLDRERDAIARQPGANLAAIAGPESLAYVLFTSGTTGTQKAVGVPHRAILRLVFGLPDVPLGDGNTVLHLAPLAFDASTFEIWGPLLRGGQVALAPEGPFSADTLEAWVKCYGVSTLWLTASLFDAIVDERPEALSAVRHLLIGGETLSVPHVRRALAALRFTNIFNGYGPTEGTTFACCHPIRAADAEGAAIPIGRPLLNTRVYVLDPDRRLLPEGETGELWIGGDGLARGYLDDEELTAARFVPDPFVDDPMARMYRTGDRARFRPDGSLDFLGRTDDQMKIRGFRIEPSDVEAALAQLPTVARAAVVAVDLPAVGRSLVAFVVPKDAGPEAWVDRSVLRDALRQRLPEFMIPSVWIARRDLPLLSTGKVDRAALPALALRQAGRVLDPTDAPRPGIEATIADIWRSLLGESAVGRDENFFAIGGHSLLAVQVVSRINDACGLDLDLRTIFEAPTVAAMAARVESARRAGVSDAAPIPRVPREADLPLSFAQERLWFLQRFHENGVYNVPVTLRLEGPLDVPALRRAQLAIVDRHEALRTVFPEVHGIPMQRVLNHGDVHIRQVDVSDQPRADAEAAAASLAVDEGRQPFNLVEGPVFRTMVVRLAPSVHIVQLTFHHIVADGWSLRVFLEELGALYGAATRGESLALRPLAIQYADFAVWQRNRLGALTDRHLSYWRGQLQPPVTPLELPLDRPRPPETTDRGERVRLSIGGDLSSSLERVSREEGATVFMTLLATFHTLLHRYTGADDVSVGVPVANRTRLETEELVGCFVNTLVMRADLSGRPSFRTVLQRTRKLAIEAQVHQDLPFEVVVDSLHVERRPERTPLFQALFVLQDRRPALQLPGVSVSSVPLDFGHAKFELTLTLHLVPSGVSGSLEYNADLFDRRTAEDLASDFGDLLHAVLTDPDRAVCLVALPGAARRCAAAPYRSLLDTPTNGSTARHRIDPESPAESALLEIWRRVLDVPAVGVEENFFDLGGNSLLAVRLLSDIHDRFGVKLRLSSVFRSGTIAAQAALLAAAPLDTGSSPLVPIQPHGTRPPFFLVHGIGGEAISFQALGRRLGPGQPVYGLQSTEPDGFGSVSRIEEVAGRYVRAIRGMVAKGPYRVGGYSAGGVIAYEMAQQLVASGEQIDALVMLDASAPKAGRQPMTAGAIWRLVKNAAYWPIDDEFFRMGWKSQRRRLRSKAKALNAKLKKAMGGDSSPADIRDQLGVWDIPAEGRAYLEQYARLMRAYRPLPYEGRVIVLRARTLSLTYRGSPDLGWGRLARGGVRTTTIPGAHDTILREPCVRALGDALIASLDEGRG